MASFLNFFSPSPVFLHRVTGGESRTPPTSPISPPQPVHVANPSSPPQPPAGRRGSHPRVVRRHPPPASLVRCSESRLPAPAAESSGPCCCRHRRILLHSPQPGGNAACCGSWRRLLHGASSRRVFFRFFSVSLRIGHGHARLPFGI